MGIARVDCNIIQVPEKKKICHIRVFKFYVQFDQPKQIMPEKTVNKSGNYSEYQKNHNFYISHQVKNVGDFDLVWRNMGNL